MLTLNDGRSELWQWDTNRKLTVDAECSQLHFSNKVFGRSIDVDVVDGVATIPDILLQTDKELTAWAFVGTPENGYTKISKVFKVNKRNKPADYVFTPSEQITLGEILERLEDIESEQDPDAIKNAVDDYLANNPIMVEETDPTVPKWAKQPNPPEVKIPDKLPNPHSITFTGSVNTSYDGSNPVEIKIPDSGGNFTNSNITLDYAYDDESFTSYTIVRVYKNKLDGTKQYPFVYAPNADGGSTMSAYDVAIAKGFEITMNAGMGAGWKGPDGMLIQNGEVLQYGPSVAHPDCMALTINADGDLGYAEIDANADDLVGQGVASAVCGFMPIVLDYKAVPKSDWNNISHYNESAQRQIIGQFANGDYAILSCDGRGYNNSTGWTIEQAQNVCIKHGLKFAYNLDGGGSTATVIQKKQLNLMYDGGTGRKIPVCIVFTGGTEAPKTETADRYGVLSMLTNATISGCPDYVSPGTGFTATVTPESGYEIDNIIVTMRGLDITTQAVSGNVVSVTSVTGKVVIVVHAVVSPDVPGDYTEVDYIESTGEQYIITDIFAGMGAEFANTKTVIDAEVQFDATINKRQLIGSNPVNYFGVTANGFYECNGGVSSIHPSENAFDHIVHECETDSGANATANLYVNGNLVATKQTNDNGVTGAIALGALGEDSGIYAGLNSSVKMKKVNIVQNEEIVGMFIPCVRKSDNKPGMYDTVTKTFFVNDGTGEFLYG